MSDFRKCRLFINFHRNKCISSISVTNNPNNSYDSWDLV